jgi:acyl phosphate:glycerol-3-phosphate acyltransferase
MTAQLLALFLGGYLVGSIPFGVLVGRACKGVDIRQYGSGNIGFSNALRVLGWKPAAVVFIADALKGAAPVVASQALMRAWHTPHADLWLLLLGLAPILGHSFSAFLKFTGGRAVTTTLGVLLGLCWQAALIGLGIWLIVVAVTRYISLASILASASVPIYMVLAHRGRAWIVFWIAIAALVILRHIPNIKRLLADAETKIGERVELREEEPDK